MTSTCEARTPSAAKERRGYLKRACAVMMCCAVCFCLVGPPRARALITEAAFASSYWMSCGSILGSMLLPAAGVDFGMGSVASGAHVTYGTGNYEVAAALQKAINALDTTVSEVNAVIKSNWDSLVAEIQGLGGWVSDHVFTVKPELLNFVQDWASNTYDFSNGQKVTVGQKGFFTDDGQYIIFSPFYSSNFNPISNFKVETTFDLGSSLVVDGVTYYFGCQDASNPQYLSWYYYNSDGVIKTVTGFSNSTATGIFMYNELTKEINLAMYARIGFEYMVYRGSPLFSKKAVDNLSTVMVGNTAYGKRYTADTQIKMPAAETVTVATQAGELTVPVIDTLTLPQVIVDIENPPIETNPPIVGEGTMVGDIALEDVAAQTQNKTLGDLFIMKFPFSIPWDLANAVQLLAAPPQTPYWEVDFMAPIAHRVGGWRGDTTIVIDMGEYEIIGIVSRWTSTIMFCLALIGATKRLVWTA